MKLYPSWRTNLFIFVLIITLLGGYFYRQTQMAARELQKHSREHSEILAAVVELNIRNALLARSSLEEIVAGSLENSARFIHYLDLIEPFDSGELTAFAGESGLAGVRVVQAGSGVAVSGPKGWLADKTCPGSNGLQRMDNDQLYLFSFLPAGEQTTASPAGCVLVGLSAEKIDETLEKISVKRLLTMFNDLYDIAYVRFGTDKSASSQGNITPNGIDNNKVIESIIPIGEKQLIVALKMDRFGKRRAQMQKEFIIFLSLLILFGLFSSWWLYRVQRQRLQQTREFERKMARQHEDAALGRAAATITHELRNPLNAIGMGLQRLQIESETLDKDHHKLLVSMRSAVDRTNMIITRLKQSIHSLDVVRQSVDLADLITRVLTPYQAQCEEQQVDVEFDCAKDIHISGDKVLLEQLFENLLKNSVEAQPNGGFLKISVKPPKNRHMCRVEIVNGGFTLSSEESKLLFEPYFTSKSKGTGLGLVISNKIVEAHKGDLDWDIDFDRQQIRFMVTLPMAV